MEVERQHRGRNINPYLYLSGRLNGSFSPDSGEGTKARTCLIKHRWPTVGIGRKAMRSGDNVPWVPFDGAWAPGLADPGDETIRVKGQAEPEVRWAFCFSGVHRPYGLSINLAAKA